MRSLIKIFVILLKIFNFLFDFIVGKLWEEAKKHGNSLYQSLGSSEDYVLAGYTKAAELEEFWDETQKVGDLRHFFNGGVRCVLKVIKLQASKKERMINNSISKQT